MGCCNKKIGTKRESGTEAKGTLFKISDVMNDTFWIYYAFCVGCGINKMKGPCIASQFKELCCQGSTQMVAPIEDGVLCSSLGTELCIWSECQMPPAPGNPVVACCTVYKMNKTDAVAASSQKPSMPHQTA